VVIEIVSQGTIAIGTEIDPEVTMEGGGVGAEVQGGAGRVTTAGAIAIQAAAGTGLKTDTMKEMMIEEAEEGENGTEATTRGGIGSLAGPATGPEVGHTVKGEGGAESALMRGLRGGVGGQDPLLLRAPTRGPRLLRHPNQRKRK
jgi:hypothetical protein